MVAQRRKTIVSWIKPYKLNPPKMFNILWRDKFSKEFIRMNKRDLRAATQMMTVQPLCPLCKAEHDTVPHLLRVEYFDTHYTTVTDIVGRYNLKSIIGCVNRTNRLEF